MTPPRPYSRHGLNTVKARVKLRALSAIDMRTVAARDMIAFRDELISALGGEAELSPQRRKLVDLAARVSLYLDHVDAWLFEQRSLVNHRTRALPPVLVQRQALADHLARLLDRLGLDRHGDDRSPADPTLLSLLELRERLKTQPRKGPRRLLPDGRIVAISESEVEPGSPAQGVGSPTSPHNLRAAG